MCRARRARTPPWSTSPPCRRCSLENLCRYRSPHLPSAASCARSRSVSGLTASAIGLTNACLLQVLHSALVERGVVDAALLDAARLFVSRSPPPGAGSPLYLDMLAARLAQMPLQQALNALAGEGGQESRQPSETQGNPRLPHDIGGPGGLCQTELARLEREYSPVLVQLVVLALCCVGGRSELQVHRIWLSCVRACAHACMPECMRSMSITKWLPRVRARVIDGLTDCAPGIPHDYKHIHASLL